MAEATTLPGYNRVAAHRNRRSLVFDLQSKPVYSNHFFAAENGKNKPIVRTNR